MVGEGGLFIPGEGGRPLEVVVVAPVLEVVEAVLEVMAAVLEVVALVMVLEGGPREEGLRGEVGVLEWRRGGATGVVAPGEVPDCFWRTLTLPPSGTLGEGFLRAALLDGDLCLLTRGEVGGVARLAGGEGVTRGVTWLRPGTPTLLPRDTYRRGLADLSLCSCLTGEHLGDDLGDVLGEVLGESLEGWGRVLV